MQAGSVSSVVRKRPPSKVHNLLSLLWDGLTFCLGALGFIRLQIGNPSGLARGGVGVRPAPGDAQRGWGSRWCITSLPVCHLMQAGGLFLIKMTSATSE